MSKISKKVGEKYLSAWKKAEILLRNVRALELPQTDTVKGLLSLLPAFEASVRERSPSDTSGLIQQQAIFSRARDKE